MGAMEPMNTHAGPTSPYVHAPRATHTKITAPAALRTAVGAR